MDVGTAARRVVARPCSRARLHVGHHSSANRVAWPTATTGKSPGPCKFHRGRPGEPGPGGGGGPRGGGGGARRGVDVGCGVADRTGRAGGVPAPFDAVRGCDNAVAHRLADGALAAAARWMAPRIRKPAPPPHPNNSSTHHDSEKRNENPDITRTVKEIINTQC